MATLNLEPVTYVDGDVRRAVFPGPFSRTKLAAEWRAWFEAAGIDTLTIPVPAEIVVRDDRRTIAYPVITRDDHGMRTGQRNCTQTFDGTLPPFPNTERTDQ